MENAPKIWNQLTSLLAHGNIRLAGTSASRRLFSCTWNDARKKARALVVKESNSTRGFRSLFLFLLLLPLLLLLLLSLLLSFLENSRHTATGDSNRSVNVVLANTSVSRSNLVRISRPGKTLRAYLC